MPPVPKLQPVAGPPRWLKADLHVHSYHSGYNHDLPFLRSRDCFTDPGLVYRTAKARGMDVVTITDHDHIDGCLELLDRQPDLPDFVIGEEISCWTPREMGPAGAPPTEVHLGAYGMTEQAHRDVQPLRKNAFEVMAYLRQAGIFFSVNHLFHFYKGQMPLDRYMTLVDHAPALETRNGAMLPAHNALIEAVRERWPGVPVAGVTATLDGAKAVVAGSDAHTPRRIGRTWTSVPVPAAIADAAASGSASARRAMRDTFMANLRAGLGRAEGQQGSTPALAADIYGVIADYWLSLIGLQRHEISLPRRAFGFGFSIVSAPFEFIPFVIAALQKSGEARRVRESAKGLALASAPSRVRVAAAAAVGDAVAPADERAVVTAALVEQESDLQPAGGA